MNARFLLASLYLVLFWTCNSKTELKLNPQNVSLKPFKHLHIIGNNVILSTPIVRFSSSYTLRCDSSEINSLKLTYNGDTLTITIVKPLFQGICDGCTGGNYNPYNSYSLAISAPNLKSFTSRVDFKLREVSTEQLIIKTIADTLSPYSDHSYPEHANCYIDNVNIKELQYEGKIRCSLAIGEKTKFDVMTIKMNGDSWLTIDPKAITGKLSIQAEGQLETSLHKNAIEALQR